VNPIAFGEADDGFRFRSTHPVLHKERRPGEAAGCIDPPLPVRLQVIPMGTPGEPVAPAIGTGVKT